MLKTLRNAFISGLLLLAPIGVTIFVINFLLVHIGEPASRLFFPFLDKELIGEGIVSLSINFFSTIIVVILITGLGIFSQFLIGRITVQVFERILTALPFVKTVYNTVKQIVQTFSEQKRAVFQAVVLVEFPRKGVYAMGFMTGEGKEELQGRTDAELVNVFVPTTPNPTSGFLIFVPSQSVIKMDMKIHEGMKLIISGGAVVPKWNPESEETEYVRVDQPDKPEAAKAVKLGDLEK